MTTAANAPNPSAIGVGAPAAPVLFPSVAELVLLALAADSDVVDTDDTPVLDTLNLEV